MKKLNLTMLIILFITTTISANTDRALYIKKYSSESKTALVIGNGNYSKTLSKLKNPINDARDVRVALKRLGFDVIYLSNANLDEMDKQISKFTHKLKNGGIGLFYFAGHGLEVDKQNYLVPIGANISDKYKVKSRTIAVNEIVDRMEQSGTRLNMLILDACRNDPFHRGGGGLATPQTAKGTLIAYATAPGSVAKDNPNEENGLYTKHLLKQLKKSNINHADFFRKVKKGVYNESNGVQFPYVNDGTIGDFYFKVTKEAITPQPKPLPEEEIIYSNKVKIYVKTNISEPTIKILNISNKFYQGIKLKKNKTYQFQISKNGYETETYEVLVKRSRTFRFELDKIYAPIKDNYSNSTNKGLYIIPAMVHIKAGSFMMGSNNGDSDEKPVHKVTIKKDFYIGKYEVTNEEFVKFLNDSKVKENWLEDKSQDSDSRIIKNGNSYKVESGYEKHPIVEVSWYGSKAYTKWLSKKTNKKYKLPTEAEWEYVARAKTTTKYSFGNSKNDLSSHAWYNSNSNSKTHKVGTKQSNPWGVYDIHGNVWEWCEDWKTSYKDTPTDGSSYNNKKDYKVLRGGSWYSSAGYLRSAIRVWNFPNYTFDNCGFRLLQEL